MIMTASWMFFSFRQCSSIYLLGGFPSFFFFFFFQAEDGIRDLTVTGVQTCALPIWRRRSTTRCSRPPRRPASMTTASRRSLLTGSRKFSLGTASVHRRSDGTPDGGGPLTARPPSQFYGACVAAQIGPISLHSHGEAGLSKTSCSCCSPPSPSNSRLPVLHRPRCRRPISARLEA